jgi:bacillolysin
MKKYIFFTFYILNTSLLFAQNSFKEKKRTSSGTKPMGEFLSIDGRGEAVLSLKFSKTLPVVNTKNVIRDPEDGSVIFVSYPSFSKNIKNAKVNISQQRVDFLEGIKADLKIAKPQDEFRLVAENTDADGITHIRINQAYKGLPIYGGEAILHTNKQGNLEILSGKIFKTPKLNVEPMFSKNKAIVYAINDLKKITIVQKKGMVNSFLEMEADKAELKILIENQKPTLVYEVFVKPNILERWVYMIDAKSGKVLSKYNHTCTLDGTFKTTAKDLNGINQTFNIVQSGQNYFMVDPTKKMYAATQSSLPNKPVGAIWTIDASNSKISDDNMQLSQITSSNGISWSPTAVSAHTNASVCYDYYLSKFNRNSLNASGGNIISVINIADEDGKGMDNAYWNGQFMGYGNGRDGFKPLAGALDVAGHEMTHGVVENTAKLEYRNQSGALNESFADIFGALIDRDDWTLGEDVVKSNVFPSGALRSLENPNQGGKNDPGYQPKTMAQYEYLRDTPSEDNGGVHINSGIPNYAFYRFATASGMNKDKAEKVYYRVLTNYLTRTSKFVDLRLAVVQSAKDLYGDGQEFAAAKAAFDAVGILDPSNTNGNTGGTTAPTDNTNENTLPVNPGTESLVVFDPRNVDQSLYSGPFVANSNYAKITNALGCLNKPSVTDDGSFVYFVGNDKHIYRVDLVKGGNPVKLTDSPSWRNAAISKDGKRLAALSSQIDNNVYVFNLENGKNAKFKLFNPTYSTGVSTGEVQYADSFEWDYTGEYIVYDAFNSAKSLFSNIEFWDVGILKAWDAGKKDFGTGSIEKMFTNLDEGDNIGNPALAKTNSNIYAFDYFSSTDDQFYVIAINFGKSTDNIKVVAENNEIGYPDFNKSDKLLAFNAKDGNTFIVKAATMASDKISVSGTPVTLFTDAKWAVWFAAGTRALPSKVEQVITINSITDKQPGASFNIVATTTSKLALNYVVKSGDATINGTTIKLGNTPGKVTIQVIQLGNSQYSESSAQVSFCTVPPKPSLVDNGTTVTASGGTLYQFYINNSPIGGQTTNPTFKKDFVGSYSVRNVTADGCLSDFSNLIGVTALANEPENAPQVNVWPNPTEEKVFFEIPNNEKLIKAVLFDQNGKALIETLTNQMILKDISTGVYLLNISTEVGNYSVKVIKK